MIAGLKRTARRAAAAGGLFDVTRRLFSQWPRILMYHNLCGPAERRCDGIRANLFREQLLYIKQHYRPLSLPVLSRALTAGDTLPAGSVAITVDDGYVSFRQWVLPLLQELGVPATLFVVSDLPDTGQWLWTDKFAYVQDRAGDCAPPSGLRPQATLAALKQMSASEREQCLVELAQRAGISIPAHAPEPYALLSWAELKELAGSALVDIGSHSRTHAILDSIRAEQAWDEIHGSRRELERRLGAEVTSFCYPNGLVADYRPEHVEMVAKAGYQCATAAHFGYVTTESNRFALPRIGGDATDMSLFRKRLDGFEYLQRRLSAGRCW